MGLTPIETRREVILEVAEQAERCGYSAFFLAEGWGYDASVLLAEIALRTNRIRIGTGVLNVWSRSAASIAMLAVTLADLSGGRFTLGLGAGSPQLTEGLHDVPFDKPVRQLGAVTCQVRRLLDGHRIDPSSNAGIRPLRLAVRSEHTVPIQLAALGPQAISLCGELADAWYPFLQPVSTLAQSVRLLDQGAARIPGRTTPQICPGLPAAVSSNPEQARALASWWIRFYLTSMGPLYQRTLRRAGLGAAVDSVLADEVAHPGDAHRPLPLEAQVLADELTISGDTDQARAGLERWYEAGAQMPVLVLPPHRPAQELLHILEVLGR